MQQKNDVLVPGSGTAGKLMARMTAKEGRRIGVVERTHISGSWE
jgi:UDP-galactopyranose mutase